MKITLQEFIEEQIHMGKEHFKNFLGKPAKVTDKPITKIINYQQNIKPGQFTKELDIVLTQIKNRKAADIEDKEIQRPTAPILQRRV